MWHLACIGLSALLGALWSAIWLVVVLGPMTLFGLRGEVLDAVAAGCALALGGAFALSPPVTRLLAGLLVLLEGKLRVGTWISAGGQEGRIEKISLRVTELESVGKGRLIIPNDALMASPVAYWTLPNACAARIVVPIPVSLTADPERVEQVLAQITEGFSAILAEPPPSVTFDSISADALSFSVTALVRDIAVARDVETALRTYLLQGLRAEGIEIPRGQRDLHLRDLDGVRRAVSAMLAERRGQQLDPEISTPQE